MRRLPLLERRGQRSYLDAEAHRLAVDEANGGRASEPGDSLRGEKANVVHDAMQQRADGEAGGIAIGCAVVKVVWGGGGKC